MPTALFLHHDANSSIGFLGPAVRACGYDLREHTICEDPDNGVASGPLPTLEGVDLLIPLGSRWSVYDRANIDTWIDDELDLVREADARGIPVLGVCFGGQLLAAAHGGDVRPATTEEIGWIDIAPSAGVELPFATGPWFQWHLDVFDVPADAELLATSPAGPQAFRLRRNLALQFHPEVDTEVLTEWMVTDRDQLRDCGIDPDALLERTAAEVPNAAQRCEELVRRFLANV